MNIGELDTKIDIYHMTTETNSLNEDQPKEALLKRIWAKVEPRTGSLINGRPADTMLSKTTHVITVRVDGLIDITVDCYIIWVDRNDVSHRFDIDYILPPVRRQPFASIYCQEVI